MLTGISRAGTMLLEPQQRSALHCSLIYLHKSLSVQAVSDVQHVHHQLEKLHEMRLAVSEMPVHIALS